MPEGAPAEDNFKDYVLGTYDGEPKTPEWAEAICGVPAADYPPPGRGDRVYREGEFLRRPVHDEDSRWRDVRPGLLHPGHDARRPGHSGQLRFVGGPAREAMSASPYCMAGDSSNGAGKNPVNPLTPPLLMSTPNWAEIEDPSAWEKIDHSECWQSPFLNGEYGRDVWPGGKKPIDIHVIYSGGLPELAELAAQCQRRHQGVPQDGFRLGREPFFDSSRQYCDIVLPVATWWEKGNIAWMRDSDTVYWARSHHGAAVRGAT